MVYMIPSVTVTTSSSSTTETWNAWNKVRVWVNGNRIECEDVWECWNTGTTNTVTQFIGMPMTAATNALITQTIWTGWNDAYNRTGYIRVASAAEAPLTPEQRAEQQRRNEEYQRRAAAENAEREKAKERAERLLMEHLSPRQIEQLRANGYFEVVVQGKTYRINRGRAGNIYRVDHNGRQTHRYCIHPRDACPDADSMLAQKLLLEADEQTFLRTANETRLN